MYFKRDISLRDVFFFCYICLYEYLTAIAISIKKQNNNYYLVMETYKYKIVKTIKVLDEAKLNAVGRAGWQLCGVTQDEYGYVYYLKKKE